MLQAGANPNITDNKEVFIEKYRSPLYLAIRKNDLKCVKLLVKFRADINILYKRSSLLSIAAEHGFSEIVYYLSKKGARYENGIINPYISCLKSGDRATFSILYHFAPTYLLRLFEGKSLLYFATLNNSSLLPLIAYKTQSDLEDGRIGDISFPPKDLSRSQKKILKDAMTVPEDLLSIDYIIVDIKQIKIPWKSNHFTR